MSFAQALKSNANIQEGPKGALEHKTTNDPIIDLYLTLSRTTKKEEISSLIDKCISQTKTPEQKREILHTIITLLYKRLPRGGEGLRDIPIRCLVYLYDKYEEYRVEIESVMIKLSEFGRYNDYWRIIDIINEYNPNPTGEDQRNYSFFVP